MNAFGRLTSATVMALVVFMFLATPAAVMGADGKANVKEGEKAQIPAPMRIAETAFALERYARDNESPGAMLVAAQMLKSVQFRDAKVEGDHAKGTEKAKATKPISTDPAAMLEEAMAWAKEQDSPEMLALLKAEAAAPARALATLGPTGGPAMLQNVRIPARDSRIYEVECEGGSGTTVVVAGDGDTDLDVKVYDKAGNLVAEDTDNTDECVVSWVPARTGDFRVVIINHGSVYNSCHVLAADSVDMLRAIASM